MEDQPHRAAVTAASLLDLLERSGAHLYDGEAVSQRTHALQTAELARREKADDELVVACLLHDVGHLVLPTAVDDGAIVEHGHESLAARLLDGKVPPRVSWLVQHHVAAKRYLCGISSAYRAELSPTSQRSLQIQGGSMAAIERDRFIQHRWASDALRLRRWDDRAKDPRWIPDPLESFVSLLRATVKG